MMVYLTHYWYTIRKLLANYKYRKQVRESQKNVRKNINILWPLEVENFYLSDDPKGYVKAFKGLVGSEMVDEDVALNRLKKFVEISAEQKS